MKQSQEAKEVVVERIINSLKPEIEKSLTDVQEKTLEIVEKQSQKMKLSSMIQKRNNRCGCQIFCEQRRS